MLNDVDVNTSGGALMGEGGGGVPLKVSYMGRLRPKRV